MQLFVIATGLKEFSCVKKLVCSNSYHSVVKDRWKQRWAPSAYNPRALGVSLGISGHRTDLVKTQLKRGRERVKTERELIKARS
jgi:hypothetical protein